MNTDPILKTYEENSRFLDSMPFDPKCKFQYELMSGAVIWSDEMRGNLSSELISGLRVVWAYRSSLYLEEPRKEFEDVWNRARELFPSWPGFHESRLKPDGKVISYYKRVKYKSDRKLDLVDKSTSGERSFLSGKGKAN